MPGGDLPSKDFMGDFEGLMNVNQTEEIREVRNL